MADKKESPEEQAKNNQNAQTINKIADVAASSKIPYASTAGKAVKIADKVTGGKSSQLIGKALNNSGKMGFGSGLAKGFGNPFGNMGKLSSTKGNSGGGLGVPDALKNPNPEGPNQYGKKKEQGKDKNAEGGLAKKDGLPDKEKLDDKKDGKDKDGKSDDKKEGKDSKKSKAKDSGSILDGGLLGAAGKKKMLLLKIKIILIALGVAAGILLIIIIGSYLNFVWDTIMTSIASFFGIKEGNSNVSEVYDPNEDEGGLWVEDKYFEADDGTSIGLNDYEYPDGTTEKGLITTLKEDSNCPTKGTIEFWFNNLTTGFTGDFGSNTCRLLNYIFGQTAMYEDKYKNFGLNIDESLIISTIFYGYDVQAGYSAYENPEDVEVTSASEHYKVLENILMGGDKAILKKEDVDKIIKSTIYEEVWPYWRWRKRVVFDADHYKDYTITTTLSSLNLGSGYSDDVLLQNIGTALNSEFSPMTGTYSITLEEILQVNNYTIDSLSQEILDGKTSITIKAPIFIGECVYQKHDYYYYSEDKWKLFLRFAEGSDTPVNDYGIAGYVGSYAGFLSDYQHVLERDHKIFSYELDYDLKTMYGSGWVYDNNMNNSWINSSDACNGTMTEEEIIAKYAVDKLEKSNSSTSVPLANNFYKNREFTSPIDTMIYTQKVQTDDLYTTKKDEMVSVDRKYTDHTINNNGGVKSTNFSFDYKYGYAYIEFPGFKKANDEKLKGFIYNEVTTPKKIEVVIHNIIDRKGEFDEVLNMDDSISEYDKGISPTVYSYCQETQNAGVGHKEVIISDCNGKHMATRSFKEYILGVTYGEIGYVSDKELSEYVKTQMVAAISYTLGRFNNKNQTKAYEMRSGSCDQNWCDIYQGCSRSEEGGAIRKDGSILLATYPGVIDSATTTGTCNSNGIKGKNYWHCALSTEQIAYYSQLFEEAYHYVVASGTADFFQEGMPTAEDVDNPGFNGAYTASVQAKWKAMAKDGLYVTSILEETYPSSTVHNCMQIAHTEEGGNYTWPDLGGDLIDNGTPDKPNGNTCLGYASTYDDRWNKKVLEVAQRLAGTTVGDCSSFVKMVLRMASKELNISVPTNQGSSTYMYKSYGRCNCVSSTSLRPGDIVFHATNPDRWENIGHVAIFAGYNEKGEQMIYESHTNAAEAATGSRFKAALVKDRNTHRIYQYTRWYPANASCGR